MRCYLWLIFGIGLSQSVIAKTDKCFHIEVLFFKHNHRQTLEAWPMLDAPPALKLSTPLQPVLEEAIEPYPVLTKLPPALWVLQDTAKRLPAQHYQVIDHIAWYQTFKLHQKGPKIHITAGQNFGEQSDGLLNAWEIEGVMTLRRGHHWLAHVNFALHELTKETETARPPTLQTYTLQQSLRLKTRHWHYFDHPLFGVLLTLTEVKPPAPT